MGNPHRFRSILTDEEAAEYVNGRMPYEYWPHPIAVSDGGLIYSRQDLDDAMDLMRGDGSEREAC